jgi:hypothetical protein
MIEKYFWWIDGFSKSNWYFIQVEEITYYTWMFSDYFTIASMIILGIIAFAFLIEEEIILTLIFLISGFILPLVLCMIMYLWELELILLVILLLFNTVKPKKLFKWFVQLFKTKNPLKLYKKELLK